MAKLNLMLPWQAKNLVRPYLPVHKVHVNQCKRRWRYLHWRVTLSQADCGAFSTLVLSIPTPSDVPKDHWYIERMTLQV